MNFFQTIAVAFAMFSAIPCPQPEWTEKNMRYSLCAFPLIGAVSGLLCWGWVALMGYVGGSVLLQAGGLCAIPVLVTGVRKPDSRFFQILLDQYHLSPKETLFIGNDSTTDIAGAKSVGMPTYYIHSNISPEGDCPQNSDFCEMDFTGWKIPRL